MMTYEYRHIHKGYRGSYDNQTTRRTLRKKKNTQVPRSFAIHQESIPTPAAIVAAAEEDEFHRELQRPLRAMALVGVAIEKAVSCRPSTGVSSKPLQPLDLRSPSTTAAAEERPRQIQPPNAHKNPSLLCSPRTKASYLHRPP